MSPEVREALENARSVAIGVPGIGSVGRRRSLEAVRAGRLRRRARAAPGEMTLAELCDELCIGASQDSFT